MKSKVVFEKKYSNLGDLQAEHISIYSIVTDDSVDLRYGIEILDKYGTFFESNDAMHLTNDYNLAHELLQFLYENAIPTQSLQDIVHDCKVKGIL